MKKLTALVLALTMILSLGTTALAANSDFTIENGVLTKYSGSDSHVTIPDNVTAIGDYAFSWCETLTSVTIPDSVTSIGTEAFFKCKNLTDVNIPEGVTSIGRNAFGQCYNLNNISIPGSVVSIENNAFSNCKKLSTVNIAEGVERIGVSAFYLCDSLESITLPLSLTNIFSEAFYYCSSLSDIYYSGNEEQWNAISFDSAYGDCGKLDTSATIHFLGGAATPPTTETSAANQFSDVKSGAYYEAAVNWAVANGITNGTSATTFSPDTTCTRAQIITLLYRMAGSPDPNYYGQILFEDVQESDWYYTALEWAVNEGVVWQIEGTKYFNGSAPCTRAETVLYMWRAAGYPNVSSNHNFVDVSGDEYILCQGAISWALENGITTGTSATTFSPDNTCTRAQIVTFLYRSISE